MPTAAHFGKCPARASCGVVKRHAWIRRLLRHLFLLVVAVCCEVFTVLSVSCSPDTFLHIPKTGGTAIEFELARAGLLTGQACESLCSPFGLGLGHAPIQQGRGDMRRHHIPRRFWSKGSMLSAAAAQARISSVDPTSPLDGNAFTATAPISRQQPAGSICVIRDPYVRALSEVNFRFHAFIQLHGCGKDVLHKLLRKHIRLAQRNSSHHHYHWVPQSTHIFDNAGGRLCEDLLCFEDVFRGSNEIAETLLELSPAVRRDAGSVAVQLSAPLLRASTNLYSSWGKMMLGANFENNSASGCSAGVDARSAFGVKSLKLLESFYRDDFSLRRQMGCV